MILLTKEMNGNHRNILLACIVLSLLAASCSIFRQDPNACPVCYGRALVHVDCPSCASTGRCQICTNGYIPCPYCTMNPGKEYDKAGRKWVTCKVCQGKGKYWKRCNACFGGTCRKCGGRMQKCQYCKGTGKRTFVDY